MGANPAYHDRVRYILYSKENGNKIIDDPIGWNDDDKEISRNEEYHGIFGKFSNSLIFVGSGYQYIIFVYETYGVNCNIRLTREERNPQTDIWEKAYDGDLDLTTYERETDRINVKFNSSGLESILKSRESESIEIERLDTMDGVPIEPVRQDIVSLKGRKINLQTFFNVLDKSSIGIDENSALVTISSRGNRRHCSVGVPLNMYSGSHDEANSVIPESRGNDVTGTTGQMFFVNVYRDGVQLLERTRVLSIKIAIEFWANIVRKDETSSSRYSLCLTRYRGGIDYIRDEVITELFNTDNGGIDDLGGDIFRNIFTGENTRPRTFHEAEWDGIVTLQPGESLSLEFFVVSDLGSSVSVGHLDIDAQDIKANLSIVEDSFYEASQAKFILPHEMASKLIEIMSGQKNAFKSTALGRTDIGYETDGIASLTGYTHGMAVRGFSKETDVEAIPNTEITTVLKYKPLTTTWKDFVASNNVIWNLGLGIEKNGYKETIVLEDISYFYSSVVTVKLPNQISKAKRSAAPKYIYSALELGYSKGGEYEEAMGLDEYNAKSTFTTIIKRLKNVYSKVAPYRADSYGKEFARRKPISRFATEDSRYDADIWAMDLKRNIFDPAENGQLAQYVFEERVWQDDFEKAPTGVFSPDTATNLRFSPFNLLLRHGSNIAAGLTKNPLDYIRYSSAKANSELTTQLKNGNEYAENGVIINSELKKARYKAEFLEFEHNVTTEIMQKIEGYHTVKGKRIPNLYGLFEFVDEDGNTSRGYLINLKPNDGKFKVLISNR